MGENSFVQIDCVGKQSLPGLLIRLLELSSDGIVVTNGAQRIIYANNLARGLLAEGNEIVGDVITSFLIPDGKSYEMDFPTDGSPVLARTVHGLPLMVRCDTVNAPGDTLLYVIHERDANIGRARRALALVELEAANRRLSGILNIVLSTLDALDVPELISRVLEQLTTTMEGSGAVLYLATTTGFHLRGDICFFEWKEYSSIPTCRPRYPDDVCYCWSCAKNPYAGTLFSKSTYRFACVSNGC